MGLTRPTAAQINTVVTTISDPITVLNQGATAANIDVGFIINRNGGSLANTAIFWDESANTFVTAFTTTTGVTNANINIAQYANLSVGSLTATPAVILANTTTANITTIVGSTGGNYTVTLPPMTGTVASLGSTTQTFNGAVNVNGVVNFYGITQSYAAGGISNTLNLSAVALASGNTKTINMGTSGAAGSNTNILIGPTDGNGNIFIHRNAPIFVTNTTAATSTTTGALVVTGGVGVGGNLFAGFINTSGNVSASQLNTATLVARNGYGNINLTQFNSIFADANGSQNIVAIQLSTTGLSDGMGMLGSTGQPSVLYSTRGIVFRTGATVRNTDTPTGGVTLVSITATGELFANSTTPSTSTTTGALVVTGGVGVGGNVSASQINSATAVVTGSAFFGELFVKSPGGDEGGQINLANAVTNTTLVGNIVIDVYQNKLRIFEGGGTARGGYFDISGLAAGVATNLAAGGGGGTPGGGQGQIQFNSSSTFQGAASLYYFGANGAIVANAGIASTSTTTGTMQITGGIGVSGNVWADQIYSNNNGNGRNIRIGDDAWLGDVNAADTTQLSGAQNSNNGYLRFGNVGTEALGRAGSGPLSWGGVLNVSGNILAAQGSFGTVNATGLINTAGNIIAANINAGGVRQTTSASVPTIRTVGDQWYDSSSDTLFQFVNDGTNFYWVDVGGQTLNVNISAVQGTSLSISGNGTVTGALTTGSTFTVNSGNNLTAIINGGTSGVGNIGSSTTTFNTVFAKSTAAQYADLAEIYVADGEYEPGTVMIFGGLLEVTKSTQSHDTRVAGVVSTDPAYLMNFKTDGISIALIGRVPCWVKGPINKGDRLVSSNIPGVAERLDITHYQPGCIIGKSLESNESSEIQLIEIAIGRF
jgi:hypothetical protein